MERFDRNMGRMLLMIIIFISFSVVSGKYYINGSPCVSDGRPGICRPWRQCLTTIIDRQNGKYTPQCTYNGLQSLVCCTSCELADDITTAVLDRKGHYLRKTDQISWNKCIDYYEELPYPSKDEDKGFLIKSWSRKSQCFEISKATPYGIGGRNAERNQYPHMALLGYGTLEAAQYLCAGSVISERYILTAAHCTYNAHLDLVKFAAVGVLKRSDPEAYWQSYYIKDYHLHPDYQLASRYNDIALLQTAERITFSEQVLPICLPNVKKYIAYDEAEAAGWGNLGPHSPPADTLQVMQLKQFSNQTCLDQYPSRVGLDRGFDSRIQMCYGDKSAAIDTCQGDSGGPLQTVGQIDGGGPTLIGVTSYGNTCGERGYAGIYTRVEAYVPWIESVVWKK